MRQMSTGCLFVSPCQPRPLVMRFASCPGYSRMIALSLSARSSLRLAAPRPWVLSGLGRGISRAADGRCEPGSGPGPPAATDSVAFPIYLGSVPDHPAPRPSGRWKQCGSGSRNRAESLLAALGDDCPIAVYFPFERRILWKLETRLPDLAQGPGGLIERWVDPPPLLRGQALPVALLVFRHRSRTAPRNPAVCAPAWSRFETPTAPR